MIKLPFAPAHLRARQGLLAAFAFVLAGVLAVLVSWLASLVIENRSTAAVTSRLLAEGYTWASVEADGLRVSLRGTAPNEAARFRAVNLAGGVIDSSRVRDDFEVTPARAVEAPRFSVEMLRNDDGIQLIGLLPEGLAEAQLTSAAETLAPGNDLSDMLETAAYPAPATWDAALVYGVEALKLLPRSKISVAAESVVITAIALSEAEKRSFETKLRAARPEAVRVTIDISAPRPVLTPFTLRFVLDVQGPRFDACAADTDSARARILAAATAAGVTGATACTVGLGVPTPSWAEAAEAGLQAVTALGSGTITFSDADVTLLAGEDVPQATFDRVVGELRSALPDVFSLDATLPKKATAKSEGPAEFTATRAAETGRVELRGRLTDDRLQAAVDSFARARFGTSEVYVATRLDPDLPDGWPVRVLAGLETLAELDHGTLMVRADTVEISGVTGSTGARARVAQILSAELGQGQTFKVDVRYDEALDPLAALPTPEECASQVADVLARQKITFTPGSAELDARAGAVMDALATALTDCEGIGMEIAGHTDAQGSDSGNRALSQARAEAVLVALQGRRVDIGGMKAVGYGEARPIADNGEEAGREANRRIEFSLLSPDGVALVATPTPGPPAAEAAAPPAATADAAAETSPSVAPAEMPVRPLRRPASDG